MPDPHEAPMFTGRVRVEDVEQYRPVAPAEPQADPSMTEAPEAAQSRLSAGQVLAAVGAAACGIATFRLASLAWHNGEVAGQHSDNMHWADFNGLTPDEYKQESSAYEAAFGWALTQAVGAAVTVGMGVELAARTFKRSVLAWLAGYSSKL